MGSSRLLIYGLLTEQTALLSIFTSYPLWQRLTLFLIAHLIASSLFALLLTGSFGTRFDAPKHALFALFFCFNFFVPALGAFGTMLTLLYFVKFIRNKSRAEFFNVTLPPFQMESLSKPVGMGEGGAWSRLRTTTLPREQRLKALLAVGNSSGSNASRFLQLATGDNDDEIRMMAFNLSKHHEQVTQKTISRTLDKLKEESSQPVKGALYRTLAFCYWELIYNSLSRDKLNDFFMEQAEKYAELARQTDENTPDLAILMIRIYLKKQDYSRAELAIEEALAIGADQFRIIPYQAEIAFRNRDFVRVKRALAQSAMLKYRPGIGPVAQYWGGHER